MGTRMWWLPWRHDRWIKWQNWTKYNHNIPKNYAYQLARPNHKGHSTKCVVKGITLNYKNSLDINVDTVKDMATGARKDSVVVLNNIISRDKHSTNIVTKKEKNVYQIVFDKRVICEDHVWFVKTTQQSHMECNVIIIEVV